MSSARAIEAILDRSAPNAVAIRRSFVQGRDDGGRPKAGRLAALLHCGRRSTFEQYLLLLAWAQGGDPTLRLDSRLWAAMLGLQETDAARRTVGRNWRILAELRLITIRRTGREISATLCCEDGSGGAYVHPDSEEAPSLDLHHSYWREGYYKRLTVPGKTVMLIALTLGDWFALPTRRAEDWYGISRSTLQRGFENAYQCAVLGMRYSLKEAPAAPMGYTKQNHYILLPPFGPRGVTASTAPPTFDANWPRPKRMPRKRRKRSGKHRRPQRSSTTSVIG
jgi:hypothetical protein